MASGDGRAAIHATASSRSGRRQEGEHRAEDLLPVQPRARPAPRPGRSRAAGRAHHRPSGVSAAPSHSASSRAACRASTTAVSGAPIPLARQACEKGVAPVPDQQHGVRRDAGLPRIHRLAGEDRARRRAEVGARQHHRRALAAEFQGERREPLRRRAHHRPPRSGPAGEDEMVPGLRRELRRHLRPALHHAGDARPERLAQRSPPAARRCAASPRRASPRPGCRRRAHPPPAARRAAPGSSTAP